MDTSKLSPQEARILALAVDGVPRRYVATELGLTENTVKTHVRRLLRKVGGKSLAEVVYRLRKSSTPGSDNETMETPNHA